MNLNNTHTKPSGLKAMAYQKEEFAHYKDSKNINKEDIIEAKPVLTNSLNDINLLSVIPNNYNKHDDNVEISYSNSKQKQPKNDYITQFYFSSLSVVGLYILFHYLYVKK
jgi:hypothetical protein